MIAARRPSPFCRLLVQTVERAAPSGRRTSWATRGRAIEVDGMGVVVEEDEESGMKHLQT